MQAHIHLQQISSSDKNQLAIRTPLGWAIIGKPSKATKPLQNKNQRKQSLNFMTHTTTTPASPPVAKSQEKFIAKRKRNPKSYKKHKATDNQDIDTTISNAQARHFTRLYSSEEERLATSIKENKSPPGA